MEKISRALSYNFLSELNNKHLGEVKDFFDYAKNFYEDMLVVQKYYKQQFNTYSPLNIDRYLIMFDNAFNKIIENIFDNSAIDINDVDKTKYMQRYGRFDLNQLIKNSNINANDSKKFKFRLYDQNQFDIINKLAQKIFKLELKCSKYTTKLWQLTDTINLKNGLFVKIITKENWRDKKVTPSLKNYYNNRIGLSVSYINDQKSKFFKDNQLEVLAGIVYLPEKIICGNYFDSYTSEFINGVNPVDNLSFNFTDVNKVYQERNKNKKHDIFAFGTLTATPLSVLSCDDCHNEVLIDKRNAKPLAVFYLNEQSMDYANDLAKKYNLSIVQLESVNKLNVNNIINTKHILEEKIHF